LRSKLFVGFGELSSAGGTATDRVRAENPSGAADLRSCPGGGCGVMDLQNYAMHANGPVSDALGSALEGATYGLKDRIVAHGSRYLSSELSVGCQRARHRGRRRDRFRQSRETPVQGALDESSAPTGLDFPLKVSACALRPVFSGANQPV
jgi:hypothetical protein